MRDLIAFFLSKTQICELFSGATPRVVAQPIVMWVVGHMWPVLKLWLLQVALAPLFLWVEAGVCFPCFIEASIPVDQRYRFRANQTPGRPETVSLRVKMGVP